MAWTLHGVVEDVVDARVVRELAQNVRLDEDRLHLVGRREALELAVADGSH